MRNFVLVFLLGASCSAFLKTGEAASNCESSKDVFVVNDGHVIYRKEMNKDDHGMGTVVIVEHGLDNGSKIYSLYAHLASISNNFPDEYSFVSRGTLIGKMGASGKNDPCYWVNKGGGIHLHFEMKKKPTLGAPDPSNCPKNTPCYGYTPTNPADYGYVDPNKFIGKLTVNKNLFWHPTLSEQNNNCLFAKNSCFSKDKYHVGIDYHSRSISAFDEQFSNKGPNNWNEDSGNWSISKDNSNYHYITSGTKGRSSFSTFGGLYTNFDFSAKIKRKTCSTCANRLLVRASGKITSDGWFENGYVFQYTNEGSFSVFKRLNGTEIALKGWSQSKAIIKGAKWNTLRVIGKGRKLTFYINGAQVWSGYDESPSIGLLGFGMYRDPELDDTKFSVDWAKLAGGTFPSLYFEDLESYDWEVFTSEITDFYSDSYLDAVQHDDFYAETDVENEDDSTLNDDPEIYTSSEADPLYNPSEADICIYNSR